MGGATLEQVVLGCIRNQAEANCDEAPLLLLQVLP